MKPILFNTEMVRAILDGKKTQTRRPVKEYIEYEPGDILYVRETFTDIPETFSGNIHYRADFTEVGLKWFEEEGWNWKPSIHMPKEAARLFVKVTDVRVERIQDIKEEAVWAEGFKDIFDDDVFTAAGLNFKKIWDEIYKSKGYSWESNPYVWVIEFERCEKLDE